MKPSLEEEANDEYLILLKTDSKDFSRCNKTTI